MWDSFTSGVAVSIMQKAGNEIGENEFAEMEYMNVTVVTSDEPYGISDGSNPCFDGHEVPKFGLKKGGVHSGHVQRGLRDPFCIANNGKGKCKVSFQQIFEYIASVYTQFLYIAAAVSAYIVTIFVQLSRMVTQQRYLGQSLYVFLLLLRRRQWEWIRVVNLIEHFISTFCK